MKENRSLISHLAACGIVLAMASTLAAQTPVEMGAKVVHIQGPARFTLGNNVWQPLKVGMILKPGALIQTGKEAKSFVDLAFSDTGLPRPAVVKPGIPSTYTSYSYHPQVEQSVVRIAENSALRIDKLTAMQTGADTVTDTELDLKAGGIYGRVKKTSAASRYEIKIPNGVAGIRGTDFSVEAQGRLRIYSGAGVIAWMDPQGNVQTKSLTAGQQFDTSLNEVVPIPTDSPFPALAVVPVPNAPSSPVFGGDNTLSHVSDTGGNNQGNQGGNGQGNQGGNGQGNQH